MQRLLGRSQPACRSQASEQVRGRCVAWAVMTPAFQIGVPELESWFCSGFQLLLILLTILRGSKVKPGVQRWGWRVGRERLWV